MNLFKFWSLGFLNIHKNHIFKFSNFFVTLTDNPVAIQTTVFQMRTIFFTLNYLVDFFVENYDVPNPKFESVVS